MYALRKRICGRARIDAGFGMIELLCAMTVLSVGILAVFAMFHSGSIQIKRAANVTTAAAIADSEMEGFRAIKYSYLGLTAAAVTATDATYKSSTQSYGAYLAASSPTNQANSMVIYVTCGTAPCTTLVPTKTVAGADGNNYRVDTYITWQTTSTAAGVAGRNVKLITVIVRDPTTNATYARISSSFDETTGL
jgi:prepilin-type N-terminal cleavage/methylation domain-containing protein